MIGSDDSAIVAFLLECYDNKWSLTVEQITSVLHHQYTDVRKFYYDLEEEEKVKLLARKLRNKIIIKVGETMPLDQKTFSRCLVCSNKMFYVKRTIYDCEMGHSFILSAKNTKVTRRKDT